MEPKRSPKRTKTEAKIQHEKRSQLGPSWTGLGSVLGRFGVDLGVKNHQISLVLQGFRENRVFEKDEAWKCILDGSWVDFDAKKGPKRLPNGTKNRSKMGLKNDQKIRSVFDRS